MGRNMGIGLLGSDTIIHKKQNRWQFEVKGICNGAYNLPSSFVQLASRPHIEIEEVQVDYLNERTWTPGKGYFNEMQVTYLDVAIPGGTNTEGVNPAVLFTWLRSVKDYGRIETWQSSSRRGYAATGVLTLYDGCGNPLESWQLLDLWPKSMDFGELDMSSSENCKIQVTMRYRSAIFTNICGQQAPDPCCIGCG